MNTNQFQVLLYYKYVSIENPQGVMLAQRMLCESLNLKGRIIVAHEGINGTIEGSVSDTQAYIKAMNEDPLFSDITYKVSESSGSAFPRLSIKVRPEIVTSSVSGLDPTKTTGKYLTAKQLHQWFEEKREFYIVDMRNDYEYISGFFEGSLRSGFQNFKDLPSILPRLDGLQEKTIVTVCTGGVRCEKASGFLVTNGFHDVYQLLDGIQTYMELYPNQHFKGKLYVFDNRITIGFNTQSKDHTIVGNCIHCGIPADSYVNCAENTCHKHFITCASCMTDADTGVSFCDTHCKEQYIQQTELLNQLGA